MDWIRIDIHPRAFTETEALVFDLIQQGLNYMQIAKRLHLSFEYVRDIIYEIRKQEAITMGKLSNTEKAAIFQSWKNGTSQTELAAQYSVSVAAISQLVRRLGKAENEIMQSGQTADAPKPGIINPEFDAAVDAMIAESKSADAEEKSVIAEVEKSSADIPDCVLYAVDCRIAELDRRLQEFADQKAKLEHDLRRLQQNIESAQDEHDRLADWSLDAGRDRIPL